MKLKSRKSGISLISLIITIIVIIILAAVVIFSGMDTPEKTQLSKVISDIDNVQTAVDQAYYGLYTEKAVAGEVWTKSQFYEAVATGKTNREDLTSTGLVEISEDSLVKINLPVYEGRKWYVAVSDVSDTVKTGSAVLSPGFESQGKTYATLLDIQNGGSDGSGSNGNSQGGVQDENSIVAKLQVGDYIDYTPDSKTYSTNTENTGYDSSQELTTASDTKWRVLYIDPDTNEVLITTQARVNAGIFLKGTKGYFRGSSELNTICANLYSNASLGLTARSMTIEDLNKACGYTPQTTPTRYAYYPWGTSVSGTIEYNGNTYTKTKTGTDTAIFYIYDGGGTEVTDSDGFKYRTPTLDNPVYITETSPFMGYEICNYNSIVDDIILSNFWLASPFTDVSDGEVRLGLLIVNYSRWTGRSTSGMTLYYSYGDSRYYGDGVHPIVTLSSSQIKLTGTGDGTSDSPYEIIKK